MLFDSPPIRSGILNFTAVLRHADAIYASPVWRRTSWGLLAPAAPAVIAGACTESNACCVTIVAMCASPSNLQSAGLPAVKRGSDVSGREEISGNQLPDGLFRIRLTT